MFSYRAIIKINPKIFLREIIKNKKKIYIFYLIAILTNTRLNILILSEKLKINLNYKLPKKLQGYKAILNKEIAKTLLVF